MTFKRFTSYFALLIVMLCCIAVLPLNVHDIAKISLDKKTNHKLEQRSNQYFTNATITCPANIMVDAAPGECGAIVNFDDASAPDIPAIDQIILTFEGDAGQPPIYTELGMRLEGFNRDHIDVPHPIPCDNRQGALIHPSTGNTWTYNDGEPFTPDRVYVCSTNMKFTAGDCGTEFIPTETGDVDFPDTPEWQNITSMTWEETGGIEDTSIDNFRFTPSSIEQTAGLESGCFFPVGVTPITYQATDENGVETTCTFNVIVRDVEKPVVLTQNFTTALDASQLTTITIDDITQSPPTDNCGIDSIVLSQNTFFCSDNGVNTVTITVTDVNGNSTVETVEVTITASTSSSEINAPDDEAVCDTFTFPEITGSGLSGSEQYYSEPNGMGTIYVEGQTIGYTEFASYPVTLYAYDSGSVEVCKPQNKFELIIEESPELDNVANVNVCNTFTFPNITGNNLSGNEAYYLESNGIGTAFKAGDEIVRDAASTYPISIYVYDATANTDCTDQIIFELDLTLCPLTVSIDASTTEICDNDFTPVQLTAVTDPEVPKGTFNYEWREKGSSPIIGMSKTFNAHPAMLTTYEVTVIDDGASPSLNTGKASIDIQVNEAPIVAQAFEVDVCDVSDDGLGVESVNLSDNDARVSLAAPDVTITYHVNQQSAEEGTNPLSNTIQIIEDTVVVARATNTLTGCFDTTTITFNLNPIPEPDLDTEYVLCRSSVDNQLPTIDISTGLDNAAYDFEWRLDRGNGSELLNENQSSIEASEIGMYTVTIIDKTTGCLSTASTTVTSATAPLDFNASANVSATLDNHSILTTLKPSEIDTVFEVRLDDGIWYRMNAASDGFAYRFDNVDTGDGTHQVFFRDASGCWSDQIDVLLIGIPQFFTPNSDGFNDHWNVYGPIDLLQQSQLYIFDRYGKLIEQLQTTDLGWDGTLNGEPLPSNDYWFTLELADGEMVKGHFAMKR